MNIKKTFLLLIISLLMTFLLPNYVMAAFTFTAHDTKGRLLKFANPTLIAGTKGTCNKDLDAAPCAGDGDNSAVEGAKFKYTDVIIVDGVHIDATISVDKIVNATLLRFDDSTPDPTGSSRANKSTYTTSFGVVVNEADVFAPQILSNAPSIESYVKFTVSFFDSSGKPAVLKNVYNNTLDAELTEYTAFGGFSAYRFAPDNATNTKRIIATPVLTPGLNGNIRFSSTDCVGDSGLFIKDQSRVQTKFDTITSLTITNGQFANGTVPKIGGGYSTCTNSVNRYYGAIFAQDEFIDTPGTPIEYTVPTVNSLTTSNTTPTITGTIGGTVSAASPSGSVLSGTDTFSVKVNEITYTNTVPTLPSGKLTISGTTWSLQFLTPLAANTSTKTAYEVIANRNGLLVDQTENELVITKVCTLPLVLNATATDCVTPLPTDTLLCHSGDGISYSKLIWSSTDTVHITHPFDKEAVNGKCPDEPVVCTLPQVRDVPTNTCVTPVVTCVAPQVLDTATNTCKTPAAPNPACTAITYPLPSPMPEGAEYDDKKVTICHFPPGNPGNVHTISISLNALMTHVNRHGDTFWQAGKNCPNTPSDCPPPPPPTPTYPTVDFQTTRDTTPTITGTVGTTPIAGDGTFSVKVNNTTYSCTYKSPGNSSLKVSGCGGININGLGWSLTATTAIPVGTYDVLATRAEAQGNKGPIVTTTDQTTNELTIISSGCPAGEGFINNVCVPLPVVTVNSQTTTDTTPLITGTVGNVSLGANEKFYVVVNGKEYSNGDGNLTALSDLTWKLQIPDANAIPAGLYDVAGTRDNGLADITTDELRIDPICTSTQVLVNHVCVDAPTVVSQTTFNTKPTITGTVGKTVLGATEDFSVTVNGVIYAKNNTNLIISNTGTGWTLNIPTALAINTYNVDALRAGTVPDPTSGELIIQFNCAAPKYINGSGVCVDEPICATGQTLTNHICVDPVCTTGQVLINHQCANLVAPTVEAKTTTEGTPVPLTGAPGSSLTISSVTLTKTLDGLGAAIVGLPVTVGSNITSSMNSWTTPVPSALDETVGTYTITATDENSKTGTNTLIVTCPTGKETTATSCVDKVIPTVDTKTTTDKIAPTLTGSVGSSKSLTITIKSTPQVSGAATVSGTTWTFTSPSKIAAGNYDVEALGETGLKDATANELTVTTCTLPKVFNVAGTECIEPVPTVIPLTTDSGTPTITGTVGIVELGSTETFSVAVNGKTYDKSVAVAENLSFPDNLFAIFENLKNGMIKSANAVAINALTVSGLNWTLVIPATDTIPAGIYDVDAIRNTTSKDVTSKELKINLTCAAPQIFNATKTACISPVIPTVNNSTTTDKIAPTLTGSVGSSSSLTITVNDATGTKATGAATITGTTWIYTPSAPIAKGVYDVEAKGETGLVDVTENELTVTMECTLPKVANAAGTACINPIPTVVSLNTPDTTPTLTGTVGTTPLTTNETFSVTVDGQIHDRNSSNLTISGTDWILAITTEIKPGTYDVDAIRQGTYDETSGELVITDNIDVCERSTSTSKSILRSTFDATKYDLGKSNVPPCPLDANGNMIETADCTPPLPEDDEVLFPPLPTSLTEEAINVNPNEIQYCSDGSVLSGGAEESTDVTIKRVRIANATVEGGTFDAGTLIYEPGTFKGTKMMFGKKVSISDVVLTSYDFNGSTITPIIKKGQATGVKIVGATLENVYIDLLKDYIDYNTGEVISSSDGIKMNGGSTLVKTVKENGQEVYGTITSGMITSGTDSQGNPMRGRITSGKYTTALDNTSDVFIRGRRTKGKLINATIVNARITTVKGETVVDIVNRSPDNVSEGIIIAGEMDPSVKASTFGTVLNQTITGKVVTNSNTCFSSGKVGSRGQLNWKEVVK